MDRRERYFDFEQTLRMMSSSMQSRIWTALPGVVQKFNATLMTCEVQPAINGMAKSLAGADVPIQMPVLLDCPVMFPRGGGATMTFPVANGDECLVVFSSRCIDSWWSQGFQPGSQKTPNPANNPLEFRMHNLSDGFVIVGPFSSPAASAFTGALAFDTANVCLRSNDGQVQVQLNPTTHAVNITAPGAATINGVSIDASGNVITPGNVTVGTGATGSFTTPMGQTVDVQDGIVINIY